jgi:hypothetical protein
MTTLMNYKSFGNEEIDESVNRKSSQMRISIKEVKNLLLMMKENHLTSFLEISPELKSKYNKLVKLVSLVYKTNMYNEISKIAGEIFDSNDIVPGTLGSYVMNCLISSDSNDNSNETYEVQGIDQYKDSTVFYYHGFFITLKSTNSDTCVILVDENKYPEFNHLTPENRTILNNMGKTKVKILSYVQGEKVYRELYSEWDNDTNQNIEIVEKNEKKKGASLMFLLLVLLIFAVIFLVYTSYSSHK